MLHSSAFLGKEINADLTVVSFPCPTSLNEKNLVFYVSASAFYSSMNKLFDL